MYFNTTYILHSHMLQYKNKFRTLHISTVHLLAQSVHGPIWNQLEQYQ